MLATLYKSVKHTKLELSVIILVLFILTSLPLIALVSITNVSALGNHNPTSINGNVQLYDGPSYNSNLYDWGNCTYWVALRREQVGLAIPNNWGNASTWAIRAQLAGYTINKKPIKYSIMQIADVDNGLGHVAFVEKVNSDGSWEISEMNVFGLDEIDYKILSPSDASLYEFIH